MTLKEINNQLEVTRQLVSTQKMLFALLEQVHPADRDKVFDKLIERLQTQKKTSKIYHFPSEHCENEE